MSDRRRWLVLNYEQPVTLWVRQFKPSLSAIVKLKEWLHAREENPFAGVQYVPGFDNYFSGIVPGTLDEDGRVVTCSYWVFRDDFVIRVDMVSMTSWPV